jgi:hypothetical protein
MPESLRQICLGQRCHHAPGAGTGDAQPHVITYPDGVADPGVLPESRLPPSDVSTTMFGQNRRTSETALRVELAQPIECRRGQHMNGGAIDEGVLR